ncbi:MAG: rubrerythrin family protein [Eubacteriales bacterium]|nr:rubrerythrin family protein [Eubacteriales bacterium]MDD4323481.1 rubrerythrin family protein [Eubacteriales bacterium]MDD4540809.1 rubrerythrin family protein [Eubacteriales bacterium]
MSLKGTKTAKNLMISMAGEAQATFRYNLAAKQAKNEGYVQIRNIFEETARNEVEHGKRFYKFLREAYEPDEAVNVNWDYPVTYADTVENLKSAINGEHGEAHEMYPGFADIAEEEGFPEIAYVWREIAEVEEAHEARFRKLLANIENDRVFTRDEEVLWKCNNCGYIHKGKSAPEECPACAHKQEYFELFVETY